MHTRMRFIKREKCSAAFVTANFLNLAIYTDTCTLTMKINFIHASNVANNSLNNTI